MTRAGFMSDPCGLTDFNAQNAQQLV